MGQRTRKLRYCSRCEGRLTEADRMILPNTGWCCACFEAVALAREEQLIEIRQALRKELCQMIRFWKFPWYVSGGVLLASVFFLWNEHLWEGGAYFLGALTLLATWYKMVRRADGVQKGK